jgi:RND family efflux transporter MFP subunit
VERVFLSSLAVVALAVLGCGRRTAKEDTQKPAALHVKPETIVVAERNAPETLEITGTLAADKRTDLAANAVGRVLRTFVERGDHVSAGAILAQLDARAAALTQQEANANATALSEQLANVRAECARNDVLLEKGAISRTEYDRTSSQCRSQASTEEAARARAAEASRALGDTNIRAPYAALIGERFVSVGDYVRADSKVVTLLAIDSLRLRLSVPERAIAFVHEGTVVTFETVSLPGQIHTGTVRYIGGEVRELTRDVIDEAVVDNKSGLLIPGMFVTAHLPIGEKMRPFVPKTALVPLGIARGVFVVVAGRLQERVVQTGTAIGDDVAIVEGIKAGDVVVSHPTPDMLDGMAVD